MEGGAEEVEEEAEEVEEEAEEAESGAEEEGERRETPNEGNPVCRFWRGQRQRDWAIAVVCLKRNTFFRCASISCFQVESE